jgi:hypothetical protein
VSLLGVHSHRYVGHAPDGALEDFQMLMLVYSGHVDQTAAPRVTEVDGTTDQAAWVPAAALAGLNLTPVAHAILQRWGPRDLALPDIGPLPPRQGPARRPT